MTAAEVEALVAEVAELRAALANERGEGEGPSPGWRWRPAHSWWVRDGAAIVGRGDEDPSSWAFDTGRGRGHAPTAREAMRAADAVLGAAVVKTMALPDIDEAGSSR